MIADADVPGDDLGLLQALSEVGQMKGAHANSKTSRAAATMRAVLGR
jgi:hypothetical protein